MTPEIRRRIEMSLQRLGEPRLWLGVAQELGLSDRELHVAILLVRGFSRRRIAASLSISPGSVESYCRRLHRKLGVHSRARLVVTVLLATGLLLEGD